MGIANSDIFTLTSNPLTVSNVSVSAILQTTATVLFASNSTAGIAYVAVRPDAPYSQGDTDLIKLGYQVTPTIGGNAVSVSGLDVARTQYVGVYQESGVNGSVVATAEFNTLSYPVGSQSPSLPKPYPDLVGHDSVPVSHDLGFGWAGDEPMSYVANGLPFSLEMDESGIVTGTLDTLGSNTINVTATNPHGSASGSFSWPIYSLPKVAADCMDRKTLLASVIAYADRYSDVEVVDQLDNILYYAEARMSRIMRNREMSDRLVIPALDGKEWYQLPADFAGLRDISFTPENGSTYSLELLTPQMMNARNNSVTGLQKYYSIEANRIRVINSISNGDLEIVYYQRVPNLVEDEDCNWVLNTNPDIYRNAVLAEVEAFAKNDERARQFDDVLNRAFDEIDNRDAEDRWSGTPMTMRAG